MNTQNPLLTKIIAAEKKFRQIKMKIEHKKEEQEAETYLNKNLKNL
ncbi:hypothetical protein HN748_01830 [Candidatus Peregrinibacteria bacterium]|jgi:hypothetical protein|nr:hypothetical protein [Candidatus Peregrinibacteria bacterium]MBT7483805.1 hypothetical protein [Candidatus Peregrinibacteria bacterium]MBT7702950.1 hypothetical protein [Candidatus Peregrinibacteria bacterium]